jgi:hypothetical protein
MERRTTKNRTMLDDWMGVTRWMGNDCWLHYEILWESEQETVVYERVMVCMITLANWGGFFS